MTSAVANLRKALALFGLGVAIVVAGSYARRTNDLHPEPQSVPSALRSAPSSQWAPVVEQARQVVRAAVSDQNVPGLSVAVGAGGTVAWAEGFGWADITHRRPVTPDMRFRMGTGSTLLTAAGARALMQQGKLKLDSPIQPVSVDDEDPRFRQRCEEPVDAVSAAIADAAGQPFLTFMQRQVFQPLGMTDTAAESSIEENPEHVGEPEEDAPILNLIHDLLIAPLRGERKYGPESIATVYIPRIGADPRRGVVRMRPRNYSCFAGSMAFYSTASDLVRFGLATHGGGDGELVGGRVMSLLTLPDRGVVVALMSNVTHAETSELARRVAAAFAR
jgi:CubicO group peptidase (beta-lactamase class C family)